MAVGEDSRIVALHARLDERRARLIIDALLRSVLAKDKVEGECAVLAHHQLPLRRVHLQAQALLLELLLGDHGTHAHGDLDVVVGALILGWHGRRTKAVVPQGGGARTRGGPLSRRAVSQRIAVKAP